MCCLFFFRIMYSILEVCGQSGHNPNANKVQNTDAKRLVGWRSGTNAPHPQLTLSYVSYDWQSPAPIRCQCHLENIWNTSLGACQPLEQTSGLGLSSWSKENNEMVKTTSKWSWMSLTIWFHPSSCPRGAPSNSARPPTLFVITLVGKANGHADGRNKSWLGAKHSSPTHCYLSYGYSRQWISAIKICVTCWLLARTHSLRSYHSADHTSTAFFG